MVGIAGVGMSGLAQMLLHDGHRVTGSDSAWFPTLTAVEKAGIPVTIGYDAANVPSDAEYVVYTDAAHEDNVERMRAAELGIPQLSYFQMLGRISEGKRTIAVAGTHGKTTTTGMLTRILRDADASPTAIIGSIVADFGSNYLPGTSDLFVIEACEYNRHFLNLSPNVLVVNNLEFDHTDYFKSLEDVQSAFRELMERVPETGAIITDTQNENIMPLLEGLRAPIIHYPAELAYPLRLPGEFNQMNARAAAATAKVVVPGLANAAIAHSLSEFKGSWRRFDYKGKTERSADVYDDYGHHPTAIKETLRALRGMTKGRVIVAFHPHLYSRTRDLLDGFARSFEDADEVHIAPIYAAREIDDGSVSSELVAERIRAEGVTATVYDSLAAVEAALREAGKEGDVIMTMGAGDIFKVAEALTHVIDERDTASFLPYRKTDAGYEFFLQKRDHHAKRFPGMFGLFGGGMDPGEAHEAAFLREVEEELTYTPTAYRYLGTMDRGGGTHHLYVAEVGPDFESQVDVQEGECGVFMTPEQIRTDRQVQTWVPLAVDAVEKDLQAS